MSARTIRPLTARKRRTLLVFQLAGQKYAISSSDVEQITTIAKLHRPPDAPKVLAGFLNLAGESIPVICLRHLFGQPDASVGLWTPLIILRGSGLRLALLVDKVQGVVRVDEGEVLILPSGHVSNDCVEGVLRSTEDYALLLSPEKVLLHQEAQIVSDLQRRAQERISELAGEKG